MNELIIEKRHNQVLDLCISYGLLYILTFNEINATLHNYKSAYVIRHEEIDFEEGLDLDAPDIENINFDKLLKLTHQKIMFEKIFDDFGNGEQSLLLQGDVFEGIIKYYSTEVTERTKSVIPKIAAKTDSMGVIGSWYGVRGQRNNGLSSKNLKIDSFERWLSEVGFIFSCSFLNVDEKDYLLWMAVPSSKGVRKVLKFHDVKVNNETSQVEPVTFTRTKSVEIALAEYQLKVQQSITSTNIIDNYDGVIFMRAWPNGQAATADKLFNSEWFDFKDITLEKVTSYLADSYQTNLSIQHATSKWIINKTKEEFYPFVFTLVKNKKIIDSTEGRDYLKMYKLEELHSNRGVSVLGQRLNLLLYKKRGFSVLNDLMDVHTKSDLMKAISEMSLVYNKLTKNTGTLWSLKDYGCFMEVLENEQFTAKDIVAAILIHSQTFRVSKDED